MVFCETRAMSLELGFCLTFRVSVGRYNRAKVQFTLVYGNNHLNIVVESLIGSIKRSYQLPFFLSFCPKKLFNELIFNNISYQSPTFTFIHSHATYLIVFKQSLGFVVCLFLELSKWTLSNIGLYWLLIFKIKLYGFIFLRSSVVIQNLMVS